MRLAALTTLRLGGSAERVITAETDAELLAAVRDRPTLVLAGGSNVVLPDEDLPGTVVLVRTRGIALEGDVLAVAAGESWDAVVAYAVEHELAGMECLSGIPGSTGATPIQNVGAYGQDVSQTIAWVRAYDRETGEVRTMSSAECGFAYRHSVFKYHDRWTVLAVGFRLRPSAVSGPLTYAELCRTLDVPVGGVAPLAQVREAVLGLRRGKGMVIDPGDPDSVSAGSFFTNPILEHAQWAAIPGDPPGWPEPDGRIKTSAAWLIERAGFHKGYGDGRAGISTKHTLALVNRGEATTAELMALAREIAAGVRARFGVDLHPEPVLVGHSW
ncbi:UDP-N-acetylmuramate dehydrogenase [Solirubrobacter sp. CPCC 204708]|nr:UDP-N-acetylmuramate dehydrogenase [Solirubrobacter deserti]